MENENVYLYFRRTHVVKSKLIVPTTDLSHSKIERVERVRENEKMHIRYLTNKKDAYTHFIGSPTRNVVTMEREHAFVLRIIFWK